VSVTRTPESWGRYPRTHAAAVLRPAWRDEIDPARVVAPALPRGLGRSYGDCCLLDGGTLIDCTGIDRILRFDADTGILRAEAGASLADVIAVAAPRGWFPAVVPGTRFVTLGGAVANDVHGKNHHVAGTFGRHVVAFELARSDLGRIACSPEERPDLFRATIGGLGLTGTITWVEIRLRRIDSAGIVQERVRLPSLDAFFDVDADSSGWEHTVAWIDLLARGDALGRGIYVRGRGAAAGEGPPLSAPPRPIRDVPFDAPSFVLGRTAMRAFNHAVRRSLRGDRDRSVVHWDPFFFPLDAVGRWNRLYGRRGFVQYQCVVGGDDGGRRAIAALAERIGRSREPAFLGVLKRFGDLASPGVLSFPRPGATLAADFPMRGAGTLRLLDELDRVVLDHGGAVYPAKDARMSAGTFRRYYPAWAEVERLRDPASTSSFWRRVAAPEEPTR